MNPGKQEAQVVSELSFGSLFMRSERFLPLGTEVQVAVHLPSAPEALALNGRVSRIVDDPDARARKACGMGLDIALDEPMRARISAIRAALGMPPLELSFTAPEPVVTPAVAPAARATQSASAEPDAIAEAVAVAVADATAIATVDTRAAVEAEFAQRVDELETALAERNAEKARQDEVIKKLYVEVATLRAQRPTTAMLPSARPDSTRRKSLLSAAAGVVFGAAGAMAALTAVNPQWVRPLAAAAGIETYAPAPIRPTANAEVESATEPLAERDVDAADPEAAPAATLDTAEETAGGTAADSAQPAPASVRSQRSQRSSSSTAPARDVHGGSAGVLNVRSQHPVTVYVNGRRAGRTPVQGLKVSPGRVSVRFDCIVEQKAEPGAQHAVVVPADGAVDLDHECGN